MSQPDDVVSRILAAEAGHAAALVLALPPTQTRAVLAALDPSEVARLLVGARADRVPDLVDAIAPDLLASVLGQLQVVQIAALVALLPKQDAVRVVQNLAPNTGAELLLALPTHQRLALQHAVPPPASVGGVGGYPQRVEEALRRIAGRASWLDPRVGSLLTEVFGRSVQVTVRDVPAVPFAAAELQMVLASVDWRRLSGLVVMTNSALEPDLTDGVRDARALGYRVDVVNWLDERDDGVLKRTLVRLAS